MRAFWVGVDIFWVVGEGRWMMGWEEESRKGKGRRGLISWKEGFEMKGD